jgi:signal transduction histidine kinase/CheY-like chemotaxis protein
VNNFLRFLFVVLSALTFSCDSSYAVRSDQSTLVASDKIIIDLRKHSFTENASLDGEWLFYWKELLGPGDASKQNKTIVRFPYLWTDHQAGKIALPAFGYATYMATVLLPGNTDQLTMRVPDVYSAFRLFINGRIAAEDGRVGVEEKDFSPHWLPKYIDLPYQTDTLRLILQISNFAHSRAGINKSIQIGKKDMMELKRVRSDGIDFALTGCLLMGGIFFLGLYLLGNRDKAILFFALFAIAYSYRIVGSENYALHTLLPGIDWNITIRMEYISLFISIGLFGFYSRYLYPDDQNTKIVFIVGGICAVFSVSTLVFPPFYFTQLINPFLWVTVFCLCYVPYLYVQAYQKKRPGSLYSLLSAFVLMTLFTISLLHYLHILPNFQLLNFSGYIIFFFLQSLVLSHRVSFALKQAGEQAAEGLKTKSEFLSTMSHEIRTPLNSVIGMTHFLLLNSPREDQLDQLNAMAFSADNLLTIVNNVLDYSKIEAGMIKFEQIEFDLNMLVENISKSFQTTAMEKGIELILTKDQALHHKILGDPTRTSQVITNLVDNAIKFTTKGTVSISIRLKEHTDHTVTLKIAVRDTGIGISAEKQKMIFERFTQANSSISRSFGGTGLGLSICKRILELQGSNLELQSEPEKGSVFYFVQAFPKTIDNTLATPVKGSPAQPSLSLKGLGVLVVDDNPMNVMVAQSFLKKWGASVDIATNGQEALDRLNISIHRLILMDLHMPIMDGYQSSAIMRDNGVTLPIIALTASLASEIEAQVLAAGMNDILVKPFRPEDLYKKIQLHLADELIL